VKFLLLEASYFDCEANCLDFTDEMARAGWAIDSRSAKILRHRGEPVGPARPVRLRRESLRPRVLVNTRRGF